ncbi:MAG: hypothetical protein IKT68_04235 [Clostridia bacterium]|nr:hypothetical protein [Clostridia bacterium]
MYVCPKCNYQTETPSGFCPQCGANMSAPQPVYQQPLYQQPLYQQPLYEQPAVSGGQKALKIVGLILSIVGFVSGIFGILYCFITAEANDLVRYMMEDAFIFANVAIAIEAFATALVGMILSIKSRIAGAGKVLGLLGVIFSAFHFVLTFCML